METAFSHGRYRLEWCDLGEGINGDYNPNDPSDRPLLRADLYGDGEPLDSGSYCTLALTSTPHIILEGFSKDLFRDLPEDPTHFKRRAMELWTWRTK
jgi:hypothetical protein